jgi:hypothetical protein
MLQLSNPFHATLGIQSSLKQEAISAKARSANIRKVRRLMRSEVVENLVQEDENYEEVVLESD